MDESGPEKDVSEEESEAERIRAKVEAMLGKVGEAAKGSPESHEHDAALDASLGRLEESARARKKDYTAKANPSQGEVSMGTAVGFAAAYNLVGCVIGGWLLGFGIDAATHGTYWGQISGVIVGALVGIAATVMLILRKGGKPSK